MVLEWIEQYWEALLLMTAEMAPYLLLGFFIAGILRVFVPRSLYSQHLAKPGMKSVVKAAALGIPLPLCSCGVIPTAVGLRKEGASHGACTSFLIATPQTGVDSIAATYSLMGLPFAIVRPLAALFTAMFGGWLVSKYAHENKEVVADVTCDDDCCHCHDESESKGKNFAAKLKEAFSYAFVEMMEDVGKWLVVGLLIAALITVAVPNDWLAALHDYKLLNMLIVLAIAIPMYVCATGSIPIAVSLMAKGLTPGAGLVLLMAGPAVNTASMLVIGKVFGGRTLKLYLLSIVVGAMLFGLGIDYLLPQEWFAVQSGITESACHEEGIGLFSYICTALLIIFLLNALLLSHHHHHHHHHEEHKKTPSNSPSRGRILGKESLPIEGEVWRGSEISVTIEGMNCSHCAESVRRAIAEVEGVESVEVSLHEGKAYIVGSPDEAEVHSAIESIGFRVKSEGFHS